ncbi:GIY-YIG nuclease family protein [Vogesella sp. GCM10023246]|uniref:GIY-YIG nuclease family protein n=1 Tax=Vogesella oryzagri TaxID=3160864 RepID=A0ABV1M028_9NEIS
MDFTRRTKFVRHKDKQCDLERLYLNDQLDIYQAAQSEPVFADCEQIVSFIGTEGRHAKFVGVYQVQGVAYRPDGRWPDGYLYAAQQECWPYHYSLQKDSRFAELEGRLVIDWGGAALAWHQWAHDKDKEVVAILPPGYVTEFPGYLDFVITYAELRKIIANPVANARWHQMLAAVAGVYLIVDSESGKQYVGSAYGKEGILGRWKNYAANGHGDNVQLQALLAADQRHAAHFQFSILRTLPRGMTDKEVIQVENLYKTKLGSRAFGLNAN